MGVSSGSTVNNIVILHFSLLTERIIIMACVYVKDAHPSEKTKECLLSMQLAVILPHKVGLTLMTVLLSHKPHILMYP